MLSKQTVELIRAMLEKKYFDANGRYQTGVSRTQTFGGHK